ncbi:hypothetical protein L2E82_01062 [Cichorium intybus]|uniref:Uncharacterized protein n=1 Tax=Cichorium intybus TaxID=13427 RepID=A0ACB9GYJ7_CICIN|nr:hypothetical protein L2E82_01062 [Cichorium intybus]
MGGVASYTAKRVVHKEKVRTLYRQVLKNTLNWAVHRHLFYPDADTLRSNRKRAFFLKTLESRGWISTRLKRRFYDFLNHDGFSETDVLSNDFKQVLEVIADKSYVPGSYKIREVYQMLDFC